MTLVDTLQALVARVAHHIDAKSWPELRALYADRVTVDGDGLSRQAGPAGEAAGARALLEVAVAEALDRLPATHRAVVELRMQGYEVAAIARATGRSRRSVERALQESRALLGQWLGGGS